MNHRLWVLAAILALAGCQNTMDWLKPKDKQTRLQAADEADKDADVQTIGDITTVANAEPVALSGVGLVVGLEGTGGDAPPGGFRTYLEEHLRKQGIENVKEILASPDTSMVLVSALVPAGAHKGDRIDVDITLPPQSRTSSLRGGYLKACSLVTYETTKGLDPKFEGANRLLLGHPLATAEGPLIVGFGEGDDAARLRQGRIWGGARCLADRPFYLAFNNDQQRAPLVQKAAVRINQTFHGTAPGAINEVAVAKTNKFLTLQVPQQYRYNLPRFLRVVRLIPLREMPPANGPYRRRLEEQLLDPAHSVTAALRLEALGADSVAVLKGGLESPHALVRFASAEALAYLGSPACGAELAKLAEEQPLVRAFALAALASLDEAVSRVKLRELMNSTSVETRCGAFRALRALDDRDSAVHGECLNRSYWLHHVAPESKPLVHLATHTRAEVVLFGEDPYLVPPFSFLAGEFTVTAAQDDQRCTISRLSVHRGTSRGQCSLKLEDVLTTLAAQGGTYAETVDLLRQVGTYECLSCPVAIDALPDAVSVYDLAKSGADHPDLLRTDDEILAARDELGSIPTLYQKTPPKKPASADTDSAAAPPPTKAKSAAQRQAKRAL
jgi:hypothetical protein